MHDSDHDSTLPSVAEHLPGDTTARGMVVTLVFHPDTRRIGEWARIDLAADQGGWVLGRSSPAFSRVRESGGTPLGGTPLGGTPPGGAPLEDRHISRRALLLQRERDQLRISREPGTSRCQVFGRELQESLVLSSQQLHAGVPLLLAHNIVLLLRLEHSACNNDAAPIPGLLGGSAYACSLRRQVARAADCDLDVLVHGPTGTGKELVASAIHRLSSRSEGPLVSVNMSAIPRELAAVSLFGAVRGAYTGADRAREGYFQQAAGGSLFLDEVGDTPEEVQPQLLRALQQREVQRVGGRVEQVNVRVISATDAPLEGDRCNFRAALRHRLGALEILLMPLRAHPEDIGELLLHYLGQAFAELGREVLLPDSASGQVVLASWAGLFHRALRYQWPGNVRELLNACTQIALASESQLVLPGHLAAAWSGVEPAQDQAEAACRRSIHDIDDEELSQVLRDSAHEIAAAARQLGVSRQALYRRIEASSQFRLAAEVPGKELQEVLAATGGNLSAAASKLGVSRSALRSRLKGADFSRY